MLQARTQASFLWEKNNKLADDLEDLEDEVSQLKHLQNLTVNLKQHKSNLAPVVDKIQPALGNDNGLDGFIVAFSGI